jgi:hypothetical protein
MNADVNAESETGSGVPSRYIDEATTILNRLAASFEDVQQGRIRAENRGDLWSASALKKVEDALARQLQKALKAHVLWPFLQPLKGLAGARTARVIAAIGDPRRFPGQSCSEGHHLPPGFEVGSSCPIEAVPGAETRLESESPTGFGEAVPTTEIPNESGDGRGGGEVFDGANSMNEIVSHSGSVEVSNQADVTAEIEAPSGLVGVSPDNTDLSDEIVRNHGRCPGFMLPPRQTTGVRSIRHYFGLHVVDGHAPRRRKGVQADWNTKALTLVLGPNGLAEQIVKHRTPKYRDLYDRKKTVQLEAGKKPIQAEKAARRYAAQEFLGDLLVEWKRLAGGPDRCTEIDAPCGSAGEVAA